MIENLGQCEQIFRLLLLSSTEYGEFLMEDWSKGAAMGRSRRKRTPQVHMINQPLLAPALAALAANWLFPIFPVIFSLLLFSALLSVLYACTQSDVAIIDGSYNLRRGRC